MARLCSVCHHTDREDIDKAIVGGLEGQRVIALRFNLSKDAVRRHAARHISQALARVAAKSERRAVSLLDRVESVISEVEEIVAEARVAGAAGLRLQAIDRLERLLRLLGAVTGELKPDGQVQVINFATNPDWLDLRTRVLVALAPYPAARLAVAEALGTTAPTLPAGLLIPEPMGRAG